MSNKKVYQYRRGDQILHGTWDNMVTVLKMSTEPYDPDLRSKIKNYDKKALEVNPLVLLEMVNPTIEICLYAIDQIKTKSHLNYAFSSKRSFVKIVSGSTVKEVVKNLILKQQMIDELSGTSKLPKILGSLKCRLQPLAKAKKAPINKIIDSIKLISAE